MWGSVWGWVCWVGVGVCLGVWVGGRGWVSEFWTSGIVYAYTISMSIVCLRAVERVTLLRFLFGMHSSPTLDFAFFYFRISNC